MTRKTVPLDGEEIEQLYLWRKKKWKEALDRGDNRDAERQLNRAEQFAEINAAQ